MNSKEKTMRLTHIALLIAMNCISAYIIVPLPISQSPISLQTLVVNLVAYLLKPKDALICMLAYIAIGMIGVPVFTGGSAGPGKMFGPTGGYIWFYAVAVFLMSYTKGPVYNFKRYSLVGILIGIPVIYFGGVVQLKLITGMPWSAAIISGALPFIPMDCVKVVCAAFLARPLQKIESLRK